MTAPKVAIERTQLVTFRVGSELYAADVFSVERVLRYTVPRPIPNVPAWLDGVIDYGGRAVPVIDLRTRFDLPTSTNRDQARILVFTSGTDRVAATVDTVDEVASVETRALEEPPAIFRGLARQYLRALVRRGEDVIVVLDVAQILNSRERIVVDQAVAVAEAVTNG